MQILCFLKMGTAYERKKGYGLRSVGARLLMVLVPVVAVFIVAVTLFVAFQARKVIIERTESELHQESKANAEEIGGTIKGFKEYFNALANTMENTPYESDEDLIAKNQFSLTKFEEISNGFYIGLDDKGYIDVSGWVPDADSGTPCVSMSRGRKRLCGRGGRDRKAGNGICPDGRGDPFRDGKPLKRVQSCY
ncbi:MAG: hypothetical protein K5668_11085 [Lachnospiraceae bacterium]|nr:hypothetical protein [Lachnospiraceae bacterium]